MKKLLILFLSSISCIGATTNTSYIISTNYLLNGSNSFKFRSLIITNRSDINTNWSTNLDLTVYGNLAVFPKANVLGDHSGTDPFGFFTGPYWPQGADAGGPTMAIFFQSLSDYRSGEYTNYHDKYSVARTRNPSQNVDTLNLNTVYDYNGGTIEFDQGDSAVGIIYPNGGISFDLPGNGNHPNGTYSQPWYSRGPGTNSMSVRSNIISRYGDIIATNGAIWIKTNSAPTSVTVGTTPVDRWFTIKDTNGVTFYVPAWSNH